MSLCEVMTASLFERSHHLPSHKKILITLTATVFIAHAVGLIQRLKNMCLRITMYGCWSVAGCFYGTENRVERLKLRAVIIWHLDNASKTVSRGISDRSHFLTVSSCQELCVFMNQSLSLIKDDKESVVLFLRPRRSNQATPVIFFTPNVLTDLVLHLSPNRSCNSLSGSPTAPSVWLSAFLYIIIRKESTN